MILNIIDLFEMNKIVKISRHIYVALSCLKGEEHF